MSSPFECVKDCGRNFPTNVGLSVHRKKCKVSREVAKANAAKLLEMKKRAKELEEQRREEELKELTKSNKRQKTAHPLASEVQREEEREGHRAVSGFGNLGDARALRNTEVASSIIRVGGLGASGNLQSAQQVNITMLQPIASTSSSSGICVSGNREFEMGGWEMDNSGWDDGPAVGVPPSFINLNLTFDLTLQLQQPELEPEPTNFVGEPVREKSSVEDLGALPN